MNIRRKIVKYISNNSTVWNYFNDRIYPLVDEIRSEHFSKNKQDEERWLECQIAKIFPELKVIRGPFNGMLYPQGKSFGSSLFPKLLGSYECEVREVFKSTNIQKYANVFDVGCAEGYYAVGLALKHPNIKVEAFDINKAAIEFAKKMAEINDVKNITFHEKCTSEYLLERKICDKSLFIIDCEGFEIDLITEEVVNKLQVHDFLIEVHDLINIEISGALKQRFNQSHTLTIFTSVAESKKPYTYTYPELASYSLDEAKKLLTEHRREVMEWFYFQSKQ